MDDTETGLRWKIIEPWPQDEVMYFYICPDCGQAVDGRDIEAVFHHEGPGHEPIPVH